MANACSNFFYLWRRYSVVYQATPLHGLPRALGMVETLEMTKVPCGWKALLQSFKGSPNCCSGGMNFALNAAMGECHSILSRQVIRRRETVTAIAIKACC
jgi:hypothetical protein